MPAKKPSSAAAQRDPAVTDFLARLKHPLKAEIAAVREVILGASPTIGEGIKWNSPSFRTTEYFATVNLRSTGRLQLVFHLGAKVRPDLAAFKVADPAGLMKWLGKDRALVTLGAGAEIAANHAALAAIVRTWIRQV